MHDVGYLEDEGATITGRKVRDLTSIHMYVYRSLIQRIERVGNDPDAGYAGIHVRLLRKRVPGSDEDLWRSAAAWYYAKERPSKIGLHPRLSKLRRMMHDLAHKHRGPYVAFNGPYVYIGVYEKTYHLVHNGKVCPTVLATLSDLARIGKRLAPCGERKLGVVDTHTWSVQRRDSE